MANAFFTPAPDTRHPLFRWSLRNLTAATSIFAGLAAVIGLIGWALQSPALLRGFPTRGPGFMMPITALGLCFCAGALWLFRPGARQTNWRRQLGRALALVGLMLGLVTVTEYVTNAGTTGIDVLLFPKTVTALTDRVPGRPSAVGGASLLLTGIALLVLNVETRRGRRPAQVLALVVALLAVQALIGYIFAQDELLGAERAILRYAPIRFMSGPTALAFLALAFGILFACPERGLMAAFTADDAGGFLARRVLPAAAFVPIVLGWLVLLGEHSGLYSFNYAISLVVVGSVLLLAILIAWNASALHRLDLERKQALETSRKNESLFRAVFENAGIGIGVVDRNGRPVKTNAALQSMLGYGEQELARMKFTEFTHPEDIETDWKLFAELLANKLDSYRLEKRYIRKSGQVIWGELTLSAARDEHGLPLVVIGMIENITEAKEARDAQNRLTAILEATPDVVAIVDMEGRALYINRSGREMFGIKEEDTSLFRIASLYPPSVTRQIFEEAIPTAIRKGIWFGETAMVRHDGQAVTMAQLILAHRGPGGAVEYISTIIRDVTERKRMENAQRFLLGASRTLSASLEPDEVLQSVLDLCVPHQADFCLIDMLAGKTEIVRVGLKHSDAAEQPTLDRLAQFPARFETRAGIPHVLRTGTPYLITRVEAAWLHAISYNEEHYQLLLKLAPRSVMIVPMIARGRTNGSILFARTRSAQPYDAEDLNSAEDLAGRAALALENARLFKQARDATQVRDEVLKIVAHDLRNPLNSISLSAGMLREIMRASEKETNLLDIVARSVERANRLIQDLLDVARLEAGRLAIEPTTIDPAELIQEAVELQHSIADEKSIRLQVDLPKHIDRMDADRDRVFQVLSNLMDNAIKFTSRDGTVTVGADPLDDEVRFFVADTGPGIPEADLPHLFKPFWQARQGREVREGAGLGLSICKAIIEAHGGRIWAESTEGKGSTFYFTLPIGQPGERHERQAAA